MNLFFKNRSEAGKMLATQLKLEGLDKKDSIILALPRGGVPLGLEIEIKTGIPLHVLIVRKIGHPENEEYGIGALTEGGHFWLEPKIIEYVSRPALDGIIEKEKAEIERQLIKYRNGGKLPSLVGKNVIIVDDGLATGATARVAAEYVKAQGAKRIILALPVCIERSANILRSLVDEVLCLNEVEGFRSVSQFFNDFSQVTDEEVISALSSSKQKRSEMNL
jgi:putative phosphoribosyl transferase